MNVLEDKYNLKESVTVNLEAEEEDSYFINVYFEEEQTEFLNGEIYGFVKDEEGDPIENASVYIMSEDYIFLMETLTDYDGNYLFTDVKPKINYRIYVIAPRMEIENPVTASIKELERYQLNFVLEFETNIDFLSIKGKVIDNVSNNPIDKAVIYISNMDINNIQKLKSIESSNKNGEFNFWQIPRGQYFIKAIATGYKSKSIVDFVNGKNSELKITISLERDNNIINGTIYGIIKDSKGDSIANADVILYEVDSNNILIPIKFTKSDDDGVYLFSNIEDGNYKIKANKLIEEDI